MKKVLHTYIHFKLWNHKSSTNDHYLKQWKKAISTNRENINNNHEQKSRNNRKSIKPIMRETRNQKSVRIGVIFIWNIVSAIVKVHLQNIIDQCTYLIHANNGMQ